MEQVTIKTKDLNARFEVDGISLESQFGNIEQFYGIPHTLHTVDKKFKTDTFREVLQAAAQELTLLVEDDKIQVLDPRSRFLNDNEFDQLISLTENITGKQVKQNKNKFQRQAVVALEQTDTDSFLGDIFEKTWTITRRAEGGLSFSTDIIRQICTNGAKIQDKQFYGFIRNSTVDNAFLTSFHDTANGFSVEAYLSQLFTHNGTPVQCSLADLKEMHQCLLDLTEDNLADVLFPIEAITAFYAMQNIDVNSLPRKYLDKLPTGLTYYQAFQILTNGTKSMVEKTIDNEIKVSNFAKPKRIQNMKDVDLHWEGIPQFTSLQLQTWMGDRH